jgi:hypothetical protein
MDVGALLNVVRQVKVNIIEERFARSVRLAKEASDPWREANR